MNFRLFIARWTANRIAARNRAERRELRDHVRQQLGQLRRDEKRVRGLRLYAAWSRPRLRAKSKVEVAGASLFRAVEQAA